ncbi:STAS/SEC14 domain-containing protein [Pseudonocardia humida]|uniref:STAS/SEC14 domain-containing protein n=1 Tax=Pseudonocardia humida TaxID=2800819 RepID=A0ABT1AAR9_9PSEU|nr:STAS/SEC14 domain-containing protein [Pseudonocardia humida]MCO1660098.1 STAS/SEC14 domain-containing protein [Pseudonocardia humida]
MREDAEREETVTLHLEQGGYVRCDWRRGTRITGELARGAIKRLDELNDGIKRPLLVDMRGTASLTREGRQAFAEEYSASKVALLGESPVDRVIANFTLSVIVMSIPTRYFTSESAALAWLSGDDTRT